MRHILHLIFRHLQHRNELNHLCSSSCYLISVQKWGRQYSESSIIDSWSNAWVLKRFESTVMQFEVKVLKAWCIPNTPADGVGLVRLQSFMGLRGCSVLTSVLAAVGPNSALKGSFPGRYWFLEKVCMVKSTLLLTQWRQKWRLGRVSTQVLVTKSGKRTHPLKPQSDHQYISND